jgi:hypothetical protein
MEQMDLEVEAVQDNLQAALAVLVSLSLDMQQVN